MDESLIFKDKSDVQNLYKSFREIFVKRFLDSENNFKLNIYLIQNHSYPPEIFKLSTHIYKVFHKNVDNYSSNPIFLIIASIVCFILGSLFIRDSILSTPFKTVE